MGTNPTFTLPVAAIAAMGNRHDIGVLYMEDSGVNAFHGIVTTRTTTTAAISSLLASGTYITDGGVSATVPFTWATADYIGLTFMYEAA